MTTHRAKFPFYTAMRNHSSSPSFQYEAHESAVSFSRHTNREGFGDCSGFTKLRFEKACLSFEQIHGRRAKNDYRKDQ